MAEGTVYIQLIYISNQEPLIWDYAERFLGARTTTNLPLPVCVVLEEPVRVLRLGSIINNKSYGSVFCDQSMDAKIFVPIFLFLFYFIWVQRSNQSGTLTE